MNKLGQMTLTEAIAHLPAERREKIEQRVEELIEAEKSRSQTASMKVVRWPFNP